MTNGACICLGHHEDSGEERPVDLPCSRTAHSDRIECQSDGLCSVHARSRRSTRPPNTVVGGHRSDVVDVAHARWSTSTCITALDLCAAGLARSFCAHGGSKKFDLGDFDLSQPPDRTVNRRARLPQLALQWVDNVLADVDYKNIKAARDWLIHSRLNRHFSVTPGGPPQRLKLELQSTQREVRCIVELSRDVATRHVSAFIALLPNV